MRAPGLVGALASALRWEGLVPALLCVLAAAVALRFVGLSAGRLAARAGPRRPWVLRTASLVQLGVVVLTIVAAAGLAVRWEAGAAALVGAAAALAIGLGLRDACASFLAGLWVLVGRPLQVGDRARIGGEAGEVVRVGLGSVQLRTDDDALVTIPAARLWHEVIRCENPGAVEVPVTVELTIALDQDLAKAREDLLEAARASRFLHPGHAVEVALEPFQEGTIAGIRLRLRAHALDARRREPFVTDVTLRVMQAFRDHAIRPPA